MLEAESRSNPPSPMSDVASERLADASWITHPAWDAHVRVARATALDGAAADLGPASIPSPPAGIPVLHLDVPVPDDAQEVALDVTAWGTYRVLVDGLDADEAVLEPGYSDDHVRVAVRSLDLSSLVTAGRLALSVEVGTGVAWLTTAPGRYEKLRRHAHPPALRACVRVTGRDGTVTAYPTSDAWSATLSATTQTHWHGGETHDARRIGDRPVAAVEVLAAADGPRVWTRHGAPVTVAERRGVALAAVVVDSSGLPAAVLDAGVNLAGRYVLDLPATFAGQQITVRPAELVAEDGTVDQSTTGAPIFDRVVADGGPLRWRPRHVYHGFRYLQIEGLDRAQLDVVAGSTQVEVLRARVDAVGTFTCDDPVLDQLHTMIDRAVQSNMYSVLTDCPHREKLGWLEQLDLCFDTLTRGYDVAGILRDALVHVRDAQEPSGLVPSIAPELVRFDRYGVDGDPTAFRDDPWWGGVLAVVPWKLYELTGDASEARESWEAIGRFVEYLEFRTDGDGLLDHGLGDWIEVGAATPRALVASYGYLRVLEFAAAVAGIVGSPDGDALAARAERVRGAVRLRFLDPSTGSWGNGSQGSWAIAIASGAAGPVGSPGRAAALAGLLAALERTGWSITFGEIALPALLDSLVEVGRSDLVARLVRGTEGPGYGHQIASGATALTESWQGPGADAGVGSQNHFMLGRIDSWLTGHVAGLRQRPGCVGWTDVVVDPAAVPGVTSASTTFRSPAGPWAVSWDAAELTVDVPDGGRALVVLDEDDVRELPAGRWTMPSPDRLTRVWSYWARDR
ncbi:family 78 glycoside hydrolase catalytic domain [Cellulomonas sp. McL0617]|uniref:family 78 glycoside hydrolase catalytic domain n=1 Tax=Cellulomonas sp. McL0617 TaxID=3415675 RepID=UPI003CEFF2EB